MRTQACVALGLLVSTSVACREPATSNTHPRAGLVRSMALENGPVKKSPASGAMSTFEHEGFKLSGAEYWPYSGSAEPRYPEDVMWGFYPKKGVVPDGETDPNPDTASPAAVACAERAFTELKRFLSARPSDFDAVVADGQTRGITRLFYLWTNDYSHAADPFPPGVRPARLWYWKRKVEVADKPAGYWKWESTLTQKGECLTPNLEEAKVYLRDKRAELAKP